MKLNLLSLSIFAILAIVAIAGCTPESTTDPIIPVTNTEQVQNTTPDTQNTQTETKPTTCEENALKLIPKTLTLSLSSSHNPNLTGWEMDASSNWADGTKIELKGDVEFQKGRYANENSSLWYTRNIQNEKLFGPGGLKYLKQAEPREGVVAGKNIFIIKPTLKPITTSGPTKDNPFLPYTGTFEIVEPGFVNCSWSG
jgi:hypothetical protein